ncbi:hypothetical protein QE362_005364 [Klebsiella variicola]|nr:hypothetical protein [Klebsiella variicola]
MTSFDGLSPEIHSPCSVTTDNRCACSSPRQEPVGVASRLPSGSSSDRLPAEPVA